MLKTALLCSVVCTAFVVGGHSPMPQDKPAKVAKAASLREALKPFLGKQCYHASSSGSWTIYFQVAQIKSGLPQNLGKVDLIGSDFVRISKPKSSLYIPFSSIRRAFRITRVAFSWSYRRTNSTTKTS